MGTACSTPPTGAGLPPPTDPRTVGHLAELDGVTLDRFEDDRLRYRATIDHVHFDRTSGIARGEGVAVGILEKEPDSRVPGRAERSLRAQRGTPTRPDDPENRARFIKVHVEAPRGESALKARTVKLEGGVVINDLDGRTMRTELATYDAPSDQLEAPGEVTLEGANFRAVGASLHGKAVAGAFEVGGPAHAHIEPRGASHEPLGDHY
jgi:hypothetical protein